MRQADDEIMEKREINYKCAELFGYEDLICKHTHIVWGKMDGRRHQINIYTKYNQLLHAVNILEDRMRLMRPSGKELLIHMIQTRSNIFSALLDFVKEALLKIELNDYRVSVDED